MAPSTNTSELRSRPSLSPPRSDHFAFVSPSAMNIDLSDPTTAIVVIVGIGGTITFFCYALVSNFRESKRTHEWIALHRPLHPTAIDLRLDAALRDAQDGFNVCDACRFENLKRSIFCTLCGAPVVDTTTIKKKMKRKDTLLVRQQLASASNNHRRQARALKRKEWVRHINTEGKLVWLYDGVAQQKHTAPRGIVVQFLGDPLVAEKELEEPVGEEDVGTDAKPTTPRQQASSLQQPENEPVNDGHVAITIDGHDQDQRQRLISDTTTDAVVTDQVRAVSDDADDASSSSTDEKDNAKLKPKIQLLAMDATSDRIVAELATHPMQLTDASEVDAQRPAIVVRAQPEFRDEPKAVAANAVLNFPSKVAEFVTRSSTAMMLTDQSFLKLKIRRDVLLNDSLLALAATPLECSRCPIRMTFAGEQGIDAGGVYREWLVLISEQLVMPQAGVFRCVDARDRSFYLNPTSQHDIGEHHLAHFFATGRLLGRMLLEGNVTGFHLALPLLKIIVGQPVTLSDLEYFDADTYKSLSWLLANDGVDTLGLDFTVTEQTHQGETITVELVPNGSAIDVTDANKCEYVDRKLQYMLFESVQHQLFAFLKGLYEVMPPELLMMFDAEELDFVLSGSDEIDVDDWERHSKYTEDLVEHPVRAWFWDLVREMPNEYRRRLLLFATGSSRVPLAGFPALTSYDGRLCPFMLKGVDMAEGGEYIHSHACFNRLDLPRYAKKKDLKAVLYGILDTDVYGFTTA